MKIVNKKKKDIYLLLTGQHPVGEGHQLTASKIANFLGVSRQYVSKTIQEFKKNNIIKCINPEERIKFYESTYVEFKDIYKVKKAKKKSKKSLPTKSRSRREIILQKARYQTRIERDYTDFFEKCNKYDRGNCTVRKFRAKIFDEFNKWTFEKQGKNTLIIIVPEMPFSKDSLNSARVAIFSIVYEALKWFQKKAHIRISWKELRCIQKPHVTKKALSPKAKRVAAGFSLNIGGRMLDMSSGSADFEQTLLDNDLYDAVNALESWDLMGYVENEFKQVRQDISSLQDHPPLTDEGIIDRVSKFERRQNRLMKHIHKIEESISTIKTIIGENVQNKGTEEVKKESDEKYNIMYQ